jgi:DNA-binding transcriptional MerR regulator
MTPQKSPEAFRTISEVADTLDVPAHVLRFWESKFPQIKPIKRGGGRRYYRPDDVNLLKGIRQLLYTDGMTIKGVQKVLKDQGARTVALAGSSHSAPPPADAPPSAGAMAAVEVAVAAAELPVRSKPPEPLHLQMPLTPVSHPKPGLSKAARAELESIIAGLEALHNKMR